MPTVIDSLAVTLALDPAQFEKGHAKASAATKKAAAEQKKQAKEMEDAFDKTNASIDRFARNALKLFAIFTAGRAIKDFVADITGADAALGRLAQRIGQAPSDISALATAVQRSGGSFEGAAGSFQRFSDSIQELKATGNTSILPFLYRVQAAGGKTINLNKGIAQTYVDLADNLKRINDTQGSATANYYGRQLGLDEGTVALLVQGGEAVRKYTAESRRLGIATKEDTDAAQNFQRSLRSVMQASEGLGRSIMTAVTPTIVDLLKRLQNWIELNREWIKTEITDRIKLFADYLKGIDWNAIGEGIKSFISGANDAAKAVGGWKTIAELFFGLWAASKMASIFAPILGSIATVRLALMRLGPIGWALLGVGSVGAALAEADPNKAIVSGGRPSGVTNTDSIGALPGYSGGSNDRGGAGIRTRARRAAGPSGGAGEEGYTGNDGRRSRGATSAQGRENVASWMGFLQKPVNEGGLGMTKGKAHAVIAMMQGESGGNLDPAAVGDSGHAHGTAQWSDQRGNPRFPLLKKFAASQGKDWRDRGVQQQYLRMEMLGMPGAVSHNKAYKAIMSADTDEKALYEGISKFENPQFHDLAYRIRKPFLDRLRRNSAVEHSSAIRTGAEGAIAMLQGAQSANIASKTMNDNRTTTRNDTRFNGPITVHTAATDAGGIAADLQDSLRKKSFAIGANYGQA